MRDLDTALADALGRRALSPSTIPPPVTEIGERHGRQVRRRTTRLAATAACCLAVVAAGLTRVVTTDTDRAPSSEAVTTTAIPGLVGVPSPALDGWESTFVSGTGDFGTFVLEHGDESVLLSFFRGDVVDRQLQPGRSAASMSDGDPAEVLGLRGTVGFVPEGFPSDDVQVPGGPLLAGSSRILWFEDGWTIEATGPGMSGTDELVDLLERFDLADR